MAEYDILALSNPSSREKIVAAVTRMYPLRSGCGTLANSKLVGRLAGERDVSVWADVTGGRALVPLNDFVGRSMFFVGDLDPKISWVVDRFVRPGDVALDIGANLGLVSLRLGARVGATGKVHAFEPNPVMLAYLKRTLDANPDLPISVHPIALGRDHADLQLSIPAGNAGAASLVDRGGRFDAYKFKVPVRRLADFAADECLDRVDFVKIDVEGFETAVLEGGSDFIERMRPRAIVLEEHKAPSVENLPTSLQLLTDLGYVLYALPRRILSVQMIPLGRAEGLRSHDFVAVWPTETL